MIDFSKMLEPDKRDDPKRWVSCNRPLSPAEAMYLFNVPSFKPAQKWFSPVRSDEEVGEGKPEFPVSLQP